jgi:hypothetical protein
MGGARLGLSTDWTDSAVYAASWLHERLRTVRRRVTALPGLHALPTAAVRPRVASSSLATNGA